MQWHKRRAAEIRNKGPLVRTESEGSVGVRVTVAVVFRGPRKLLSTKWKISTSRGKCVTQVIDLNKGKSVGAGGARDKTIRRYHFLCIQFRAKKKSEMTEERTQKQSLVPTVDVTDEANRQLGWPESATISLVKLTGHGTGLSLWQLRRKCVRVNKFFWMFIH